MDYMKGMGLSKIIETKGENAIREFEQFLQVHNSEIHILSIHSRMKLNTCCFSSIFQNKSKAEIQSLPSTIQNQGLSINLTC